MCLVRLSGSDSCLIRAAMLRKTVRAMEAGQLPEAVEGAGDESSPLTTAEALSIRHSHPPWMIQRWATHFGAEELTALLEANNRYCLYLHVRGG